MIVKSVNTFRPYRSNATTTNAVKSNSTPAFMANEKPPVPRKTVFGGLKTLALGLLFGTSINCSSGNNLPDAQAITPALDATPTPALVDATSPIAVCPNTNKTAADIFLEDFKYAKLLQESATALPQRITCNYITDKNEVFPIIGTIDSSNPNKPIFDIKIMTDPFFTITNTCGSDGTIDAACKLGSETRVLKLIRNNGEMQLLYEDKFFHGMKRTAPSEISISSPNSSINKCIDATIDGIPLATMLQEAAEKFAKLGKTATGKVADRARNLHLKG